MKVIIADFEIAKYGGIIEYVASMLKSFRDLGCEVDVMQLSPSSTTQRTYDKKVAEFESGEHQRKIKFHSQAGGYQKDEVTGYWRNNYYGYFLPPGNKIGVYENDALEKWLSKVSDADIILWNFMPTKSSAWERKDKKFDFWYKFFDLPDRIKQVFLVHDAYFNVRASNISALKDKVLFLACAHLAAYRCCEEIGIPRTLLLNPRYITNEKFVVRRKRGVDFFAAHMFKSMKHMEDLIAAIPYIDSKYNKIIAGTGIEYNYMTSPTKTKSNYMCSVKRDPDLDKEFDGQISLWDYAVACDMEYRGQMSGQEVVKTLQNTRFAIDPSWCSHYAQYCRTHINGFIIEAMLNGAYPVLRDYRGLCENSEEVYDPLFDSIKAIMIPWNATPREFADALNKARRMSEDKFIADTRSNFELTKELFNSTKNAEYIIQICRDGVKELELGVDSDNVKKITKDIMTDFFGIELPIKWKQ